MYFSVRLQNIEIRSDICSSLWLDSPAHCGTEWALSRFVALLKWVL